MASPVIVSAVQILHREGEFLEVDSVATVEPDGSELGRWKVGPVIAYHQGAPVELEPHEARVARALLIEKFLRQSGCVPGCQRGRLQ